MDTAPAGTPVNDIDHIPPPADGSLVERAKVAAMNRQSEREAAAVEREAEYLKAAAVEAMETVANRLDDHATSVEDWRPFYPDTAPHERMAMTATIDGVAMYHRPKARYPDYTPADLRLLVPCRNHNQASPTFHALAIDVVDIGSLPALGERIAEVEAMLPAHRPLCDACAQEGWERSEDATPAKRSITITEGSPDYDLVMAIRRMAYNYAPDTGQI